MGLGTIAGSAKMFKDDLTVIWIDAHGDFNNKKTTPSGNIHGMPLAASCGIGLDSLNNIYFNENKIKKENVYILCARDLDKEESILLKNNNIKVWSTNDILKIGINNIILNIINDIDLKKINNIHISFDIDCMDSKIVPGTGTPVKGGITLSDAKKILTYIFESKKVKALDFVEFNPELDDKNITLDNCLDLINLIGELIYRYTGK